MKKEGGALIVLIKLEILLFIIYSYCFSTDKITTIQISLN